MAASDPQIANRSVQQYLHRPEWELYNVRDDAAEVHNLAADPQHQQIFEQLKAEIYKMMRETKDPWAPQANGNAGARGTDE
jgi:N-sulfoglucosamine sulfohydrolase